MIEVLITPDPVWVPVSYEGIPDVKIVICKGVPVMGVVRRPGLGIQIANMAGLRPSLKHNYRAPLGGFKDTETHVSPAMPEFRV